MQKKTKKTNDTISRKVQETLIWANLGQNMPNMIFS